MCYNDEVECVYSIGLWEKSILSTTNNNTEGETPMDIFNKCYTYDVANSLRRKGIYPYFHAL